MATVKKSAKSASRTKPVTSAKKGIPAPAMQAPPSASAPMGGGPMMKKGGKMKKCDDGGKIKAKANESGQNKENDMRGMAEAGGLGGSALKAKAAAKKPMKNGGKLAGKAKKFAALAPPKNKITFADKLAGAKKKKK